MTETATTIADPKERTLLLSLSFSHFYVVCFAGLLHFEAVGAGAEGERMCRRE